MNAPADVIRALRRPYGIYVPVSLLLLATAIASGVPLPALLLLIPGGVLVWTLLEYVIHRFVLHLVPRGTVRRMVAGQHFLHHRSPIKHSGIVILPVSIGVGAVTALILWPLLGAPRMAGAMVGVVAGYLIYEYVHLATHLGTPTLTPWGERIRAHHRVHHERCARRNYGVTVPLWDLLLGTLWRAPSPAGAARSVPAPAYRTPR